MYSVLFAPTQNQTDRIIAEVFELGTAGIIEEGSRLRVFFEDDIDTSTLRQAYTAIEVRHEEKDATTFFDKTNWEPILAGNRFFIAPSWIDALTPEGRFRLTVDDSTAFGTGRHETTQLMLLAMEQTVKPGDSVLDVGAGSGVLSVAAPLLGASQVFTCDIQPESVAGSVRAFDLAAFVGSADAIADYSAHLTLANISARIVDLLAYDLKRVTKPGGHVLVSGFIKDGPPQHFHPISVWEQNEWQCWLCRPDGIEAGQEPNPLQPHSQHWW